MCLHVCRWREVTDVLTDLRHRHINGFAVLYVSTEDKSEVQGDEQGWLYQYPRYSTNCDPWNYVGYGLFYFLTVLLGKRKWAFLVNKNDCLHNRIDYLFKMAYAARL